MLARKKAEAAEGHCQSLAKKPSSKLAEFVEDYLAHYQANRSPQSARRPLVLWHVIQSVLGHKRLDEISPFDLERHRGDRKQVGRADASVNRELAFLKNCFAMAMTGRRANSNPVQKVRFARVNCSP